MEVKIMPQENDALERWLFEDLFNPERIKSNKNKTGVEIQVYIQKKQILIKRLNYDEIVIGRNSSTETVDLDLGPYDNGKTISRKSLVITRINEKYEIKNYARIPVKINDTFMQLDKPYELKKGGENLVIIYSNPPIGLKIKIIE